MRVLIDTNVLLSASLSASGTPYKAIAKTLAAPNEALVCEETIGEFRDVIGRKFPHRLAQMELFLRGILKKVKVVPVPLDENALEEKIRDVDDRPILRAALAARADAILTGDRDFLESGLVRPLVLAPASFLCLP